MAPVRDPRRARVVRLVVAGCAYLVAIAVLSWPLPRALATSVVDAGRVGGGPWARADLDLLVWVLAWGAHAVATQPLAAFDGNIFHPAPDVLASSENLLGLLPFSAPAYLATGNAVVAYNVTVLLVVLVLALGTFLLAREWGADDVSAWLAGAAFAFAPLTLRSWVRLHVTAVHLIPVVVLLAWRATAAPRWSTLALLALATGLQLLSGVYVAFELGIVLAALLPILWWRARRHGQSGLRVAGALATGALLLAPVVPTYLRLQATGVLPSGPNPGTALLWRLVAPDALAMQLHASFGWPLIALAALGLLWPGTAAPAPVRLGLLCMGGLGFAFALGPDQPGPYALAARIVPGFGGMRAPIRFLVVPLLAAALAAGLGMTLVRRAAARAIGAGGARLLVVAACAALVAVYRPADGLPLLDRSPEIGATSVHDWLARHGDGKPIVAVPASPFKALDLRTLRATTGAMVGTTRHWQPLVNGYSGYPPPSDALLMTIAQRLPERDAFEDLCRLVSPGWFLVRRRFVSRDWLDRAEILPTTTATRAGDDVLLRVTCQTPPSLLPALRRQLTKGDDGYTLLGLDRRMLAPEARHGELWPIQMPPDTTAAGVPLLLWTDVEHTGRDPWPGMSAWPEGTVAMQTRWRDAASGAVVAENPPTRLARDVRPGEWIRAQVQTVTPSPGSYELEIGLVRIVRPNETEWFADGGGSGLLRRRVEVVALKHGRGARHSM